MNYETLTDLELVTLAQKNDFDAMETLIERGYAKLVEKKFEPTEVGFEITDKLQEFFSNLINVKYTAKMENDLDKIKSKVLIVSCKQDPHFPPELDGIPMSEMIKDSELIIMDSELGHLCFNELENISYELSEFMGEFDDC